MNFISVSFAVFITVLLILLYLVKDVKKHNIILLAANMVFYCLGDLRFILLLLFEIICCYFLALKTGKEKEEGRSGNLYTGIGVVISVFVLLLFKYVAVIGGAIFGEGLGQKLSVLKTLQPLGISFYTFMIISYLVDVYREKMSAEKDFVVVALYVSFFPQIMSGPITKARDFIKQFKVEHPIEKKNVYAGLQIFLTGVVKKVLIADRLAVCSQVIFASPSSYSGMSLLWASLGYMLQIYCDFSGYSDMAIGIAKSLGYELALNFDMPYISKSPSEFWTRWHVSMCKWLQEYVYFSLGGSRKGTVRKYINLFITMMVGSLWHGADIRYLVWGLIFSVAICLGKAYEQVVARIREKRGYTEEDLSVRAKRIRDTIYYLMSFVFMFVITILFKADTLHDTWVIFTRILTAAKGIEYYYVYIFIYLAVAIAATIIGCVKNNMHGFYINMDLDRLAPKFVFLLMIAVVAIFGYFGNSVFIYAQY